MRRRKFNPASLTATELGWLAGLIEGEGTFAFKSAGGRPGNLSPMIRVAMSDEDVIARLARLWDRAYQARKVKRPAHWSQMYETEIKGTDAAEVMRTIRPLMGLRRGAKIDTILAQYQL